MGATLLIFARKTSIVSESHAKFNLSNLSLGLGALALLLNSREQIKKRREILKREEKSPSFPFEGNEGLPSLHGEMCATARTHLLGEKRATARPLLLQWSGMCEGATYGKVVPSRLSHLRSVS